MATEWVVQGDKALLNGDPTNYVCPHTVPIGNSMGQIYRIYLNGKSVETRNTEEVARRRLEQMVAGA